MPSVAEFLLERIQNAGIKHVFGANLIATGDVLNFYKKLNDNENIDLVNCTDETHAGFAANTYARLNGIGCVCTTYNVGALKITNSVACAYAERCPVVVVSNSPSLKEREEGSHTHHMARSFECQKEVFQKLTCASVVLDDPASAGYKIDFAFEALHHHKQPIYIELPRDIADKPISYDVYRQGTPNQPKTDKQNLEESLKEVIEWINSSKNPVILAGVQLSRFDLGLELIKFAEKANIPIATTLLAKSVVNERHPLFLGIYSGISSKEAVRKAVEESDCLLMFGVMLTDITGQFMPPRFAARNAVNCAVEGLQIKNHTFTGVQFNDFCKAVFSTIDNGQITKRDYVSVAKEKPIPFVPTKNKITFDRFFEKINSILSENYSVIADVGNCLYGAADLIMHHKSSFIASSFYMGGAIPGALGMALAQPARRPIVLVGDDAFQMSCTELGTILARNMNPIVFVLNNKTCPNWNYHLYNQLLGGGEGYLVENEEELEEVVLKAITSKQLTLINVSIDPTDVSPALKRITEGLSKKV